MLKIKKESENLVCLELSGKLDSTDMELGLNQLIEATQGMENGKMLYFIEDFEWPTLGALMVEFGKLPSLFAMISRIEKVAVIAEANWLRNVAEWEGALIPGLEIESFVHGQEEEARAWLSS